MGDAALAVHSTGCMERSAALSYVFAGGNVLGSCFIAPGMLVSFSVDDIV